MNHEISFNLLCSVTCRFKWNCGKCPFSNLPQSLVCDVCREGFRPPKLFLSHKQIEASLISLPEHMTVRDRVAQHFGDIWTETEQVLVDLSETNDQAENESKRESERERPTVPSTCQFQFEYSSCFECCAYVQVNWILFHVLVEG